MKYAAIIIGTMRVARRAMRLMPPRMTVATTTVMPMPKHNRPTVESDSPCDAKNTVSIDSTS